MPNDLVALSAAPSNHLKVWSHNGHLYVELPGPYVTKLRLSEGGLSKAIALISGRQYDFGGEVQPHHKAKPRKPISVGEAMAEAALRRRRII